MTHILSLDDPRIAPYRCLKDRELAREGDRFIAEGELVVRRLLRSDYPCESVLLAERRAAQIAPLVGPGTAVYVVPDELVGRIIGFNFHSGVIAVGKRKPPVEFDEIASGKGPLTLVICPETASARNMGALIRISAAFGADAMVLGERSCDPFWRQSIRISVGTIFSLPLVQSKGLLADLDRLRKEFGIELIAAVADGSGQPLRDVLRGPRIGMVFGNEAQGLSDEFIRVCDRRATIPMKRGIDSLNVAVAAGIFLYHLTAE